MWIYFAVGVPFSFILLLLFYTAYIMYVHDKYAHFPSPKRSSFYLGHILDIRRMHKESGNNELPINDMAEKWIKEAGSNTFVLFIFHKARILTADSEVIKAIVKDSKNLKGDLILDALCFVYGIRLLGNGLFTNNNYELWRSKRKAYDPIFHKSHLATLATKFNSSVDKFVSRLKPLADGNTEVPMKEHVFDFAIDLISKAVSGCDFTNWDFLGLSPTIDHPLLYMNKTIKKGCERSMTSLRPSINHYLHPFEAKPCREAASALRKVGKDCIERRIKAIENGEELPNDILTAYIQCGARDVEDLVDDFITFFAAGSETTTAMLLFSIVLSIQHPTVMEKLVNEVETVLNGRTYVTPDDIEKLVYTEQVLSETLRYCPVVPGITKTLYRDQTICDKNYPKGTTVMLLASYVACLPEHFANTDIFDPDRFSPQNKKPSSFVYFPFGVGQRTCIGKQFSLMEAKMLLARLIQTYQLKLPDSYEMSIVQKVTLQPGDDVPCKLLLR